MNRFDMRKVTSAWWFHVLILGKKPSYTSVTHTKLLRNNAVPEGILKTDQVLREEEADKFERICESFNILV